MKVYFDTLTNTKTNKAVDIYVKPDLKMIMPKMLAGIGAMLGGLAVGATIIFRAAFENGVKESNAAEAEVYREVGIFGLMSAESTEEITTS